MFKLSGLGSFCRIQVAPPEGPYVVQQDYASLELSHGKHLGVTLNPKPETPNPIKPKP